MIVADTSVLVEHLRGNEAVTDRLKQEAARGPVLVPALVAWELWKGASNATQRQAVDQLLAATRPDPFMPAMGHLAADLHQDHRRQGVQRPQWDLLIASHALHHDIPLATVDGDFSTIAGLEVLEVQA